MKTILLVDSSQSARQLYAELLRGAGYCVCEAGDGFSALRHVVERADIDLLIADDLLPGLSGVEVIQWLQRFRPEMPTLLVSAIPENLDAAQAQIPSLVCVSKLSAPEIALAVIQKLIDQADDESGKEPEPG